MALGLRKLRALGRRRHLLPRVLFFDGGVPGCSPVSSRALCQESAPASSWAGRFEWIPRPLSVDSIKRSGTGSGPWMGRLCSGDSGVGLSTSGELACSRGLWNLLLFRCWGESGA